MKSPARLVRQPQPKALDGFDTKPAHGAHMLIVCSMERFEATCVLFSEPRSVKHADSHVGPAVPAESVAVRNTLPAPTTHSHILQVSVGWHSQPYVSLRQAV